MSSTPCHIVAAAIAFAALAADPARAQVQPFGTGCPAASGSIPTLTVDGPPLAQSPFTMTVTTDPGQAVLFILGQSMDQWGAVPLPLDLGAFGYPGCSLLVNGDGLVETLATDPSGVASISASSLPAGLAFFAQALVVDASLELGATRGLSVAFSEVPDPFTVVMLPDTQHYSESGIHIAQFEAQTQWVVDELVSENLAFVTHTGDLVQNGAAGPTMNQVEWDRADGAMSTLDGNLLLEPDGLVPYSAVPGNRDYDVVDDKLSADQYFAYFGPDRYSGRDWFVGASPDGFSMAQRFEADGAEYLHLGIEWRASDAAIAWAQEVLVANSALPTIVTTHQHLQSNSNTAAYTVGGATPDSDGDNDGDAVFHKLVDPFPQVFLTLCGHLTSYGRRESQTALGQTVHEVLANYQSDPSGGNGWMQLLRFRSEDSELEFDTFSPTYVPGVSPGPNRFDDPNSNFELAFDFMSHRTTLEATTAVRFRNGQDLGFGTYAGAVDTHIGDGDAGAVEPDTSYELAANVRADGNGDDEHGLLRFTELIGSAAGSIPPGTQIERAILTLTTEGPNSESDDGAKLHRMLVPWDGQSTWNSLGDGIQLGTEALLAADVEIGGIEQKGTRSFDVTASVQAWADGETNLGWVVVANGNDRWEFRSSDWTSVAERPLLTVLYR